ncbi:MAG: 50S ribosomal protein L6, partial [Desulfomonilia bacterium]|nr:50S ribosomal protein L6 [Desulfomonilia bacterium]
VAARIRKTRKPDAYKGKGIRYAEEVLRLKPGKSAAKG